MIGKVKTFIILEVSEFIIDSEFAGIGILANMLNCVIVTVVASCNLSPHVKCGDNIRLSYTGVLQLSKRILVIIIIVFEWKMIYWNKFFRKNQDLILEICAFKLLHSML